MIKNGGNLMLSCKNCGAEMSGIDLICKNCGTPWGKKHKSRKGMYISAFILVAVGITSYIVYMPGAKEKVIELYNTVLASIPNDEKNINKENASNKEDENTLPIEDDSNIIIENETSTPPPEELENEIIPPDKEAQKEPNPPVFSWVSASSSLKNYEPELTIDGKLETAWLEGVKGNGIGEWLLYSAETDQTVSSITIYNGYLKNDKVYINNGRLKKLSLEFSDGEIITKDISKTSFTNAKNGYVINLETPKVTSSVKLTILDAYQGAYYTDTGISGISFK